MLVFIVSSGKILERFSGIFFEFGDFGLGDLETAARQKPHPLETFAAISAAAAWGEIEQISVYQCGSVVKLFPIFEFLRASASPR
jgi:hypothetical protein